MPELRIRNIESWIVETFRSLARSNGRSMEAEIKDFLKKQALGSKEQLANEMKDMTDEIRAKYGELSGSETLIRADRDSRG